MIVRCSTSQPSLSFQTWLSWMKPSLPRVKQNLQAKCFHYVHVLSKQTKNDQIPQKREKIVIEVHVLQKGKFTHWFLSFPGDKKCLLYLFKQLSQRFCSKMCYFTIIVYSYFLVIAEMKEISKFP